MNYLEEWIRYRDTDAIDSIWLNCWYDPKITLMWMFMPDKGRISMFSRYYDDALDYYEGIHANNT